MCTTVSLADTSNLQLVSYLGFGRNAKKGEVGLVMLCIVGFYVPRPCSWPMSMDKIMLNILTVAYKHVLKHGKKINDTPLSH